jgi:hypothetical protein
MKVNTSVSVILNFIYPGADLRENPEGREESFSGTH